MIPTLSFYRVNGTFAGWIAALPTRFFPDLHFGLFETNGRLILARCL